MQKNYLEKPITIYENATRSKRGRKGTFAEFILLGIDHQNQVEAVREAANNLEAVEASTDNEEAIKKAKDQLKQLKATTLFGATISGYFPEVRQDDAPFTHSGLICIDIDHCDPTKVMGQLRKMDCVLYASRSASGKGVFAVIPLAYPEKHREQFCALSLMFREMGIVLDEAPKSIASLRFMSYDDEAFLRHDAVEFKGVIADVEAKKQTKGNLFNTTSTPHTTNATSTTIDPNSTEFKSALRRAKICVEEIERRHIDLCPDNGTWHVMASSLSTLGAEGESLFNRIAQQCTDPQRRATPEENSREFNRALRDNRSITIATFFDACSRYGINAKGIEEQREVEEFKALAEEAETSTPLMTFEEWQRAYPNTM